MAKNSNIYLKSKDKKDKEPLVQKWLQEISDYETIAQPWLNQCKKILRIYSAKRPTNSTDDNLNYARFNLLWANIQTMLPAIYAKLPEINISRRNKSDDDVGRVTSDILERSSNFILDCTKANDTFRTAMFDYLLCGRAALWARYEAEYKEIGYSEENEEGEEEQVNDLDYEEVKFEYVNYKDFGHNYAEKWEDVTAVWRKLYLTRTELKKYFGNEIGKEIPLNSISVTTSESANNRVDNDRRPSKACIYEIWDKSSRKVIWISKDYHKACKEQEDFLKLKEFFPCTKPLYSTITNDSLIPIPDYILYQDQAMQLDELSQRIKILTKALRVAGVYDASTQGLQNLLTDTVDNQLYPVDSWASFAEKGGLQGVISWLPIKEIAEVLQGCLEMFEKQKAFAYEITGISDLLRGLSDPRETATGINEKKFSGQNRFQDRRAEVSRFLRDNIQILTEIMAENFEIETLKLMSNIHLFEDEQQKQQTQMMLQQQQLQYSERLQEMLDNPTWQEVTELLHNDKLRTFRIDVETDSTIRADEQQQKSDTLEFLSATSSFLKEAVPAAQQTPQLAPVLGQMLLMGVRSFKVGKTIEAQLEKLVDDLNKNAQNPPPPPPNADIIKAQAEQQAQQMQMQIEQQKLQLEYAKLQQVPQIKQMELEHNIYMDKVASERIAQDKALQAQLDQQTTINQQQQQSLDTLRTAQIELDKEIQLKSIDAKIDRENQDLEAYKVEKQEQTKENIALLNAHTSLEASKNARRVDNGKM
jgi:hypothetical protein